jgi:pimeloyl-ACP methyl ester carboxylesterase
MAEAIPNAETAIVRGATHGAVIEKPNQVNAAVRSFLARRDAVVRRGADGGAAPHR